MLGVARVVSLHELQAIGETNHQHDIIRDHRYEKKVLIKPGKVTLIFAHSPVSTWNGFKHDPQVENFDSVDELEVTYERDEIVRHY